MDILSVFGIRGRSKEVHHLNDALRDVGLHSARVPDSVKLAAVKLLKEAEGGKLTDPAKSCAEAAPLLAYCMLGIDDFTSANGETLREAAECRLRLAIDYGESLDARLAMLTLIAGTIHPGVVEAFDLELAP